MEAKKRAAEKAVDWLENNMVVGLGTGSTAYWAIQKIGEKIKEGFNIKAVATSVETEKLAAERAIPILPFSEVQNIDLTIDGADEVDQQWFLIKGGGGALLREKIVAYHSRTYIIVVDEGKKVEQLGKFPLPVEIVPFGAELTVRRLNADFGPGEIRKKEGADFITDNGNLIVDLNCFPITDPAGLNQSLHEIPGVVETGLFDRQLVSYVLVGNSNGQVIIEQVQNRAD